jgi:hypothetical protein
VTDRELVRSHRSWRVPVAGLSAGSGAVWRRSDRGQNVHRAQSRSLTRVLNRITLHGSIVGTHQDLTEVFQLHRLGRTLVIQERRPLDRVNEAFTEVWTCGRGRPGRLPVPTVPDRLGAPVRVGGQRVSATPPGTAGSTRFG